MPVRPAIAVPKHLENETRSLLSRAEQILPFSLSMPMVPAAGVSREAKLAIDEHWAGQQRKLVARADKFIQILQRPTTAAVPEAELQGHFATLKLGFNQLLDQFDIFADVVSQRAEQGTGVWVAGLDVLAADALRLGGRLTDAPPLICFLERGHGAAIRKARTRLPGGSPNPVGIIQVPRERMVGAGIAASLIHEVGHQGATLLDLVPTIRAAMRAENVPPEGAVGWSLLNRWLSEILADFWAMAHLGIGATLGLMSVVSLPNYFMFRYSADDPHPFPWIRVQLSLAFGERLFPDAQWARHRHLWQRLYPLDALAAERLAVVRSLAVCTPAFVELVVRHRTAKTFHEPLPALFPVLERQPQQLRALFGELKQPFSLPPSLVFALAGQARADGRLAPYQESQLLTDCLTHWAWRRAEVN